MAPDSRVMAVPCEGTVRLYELPGLREVESIAALGTNVMAVAYSPDGTLIVSGSTNGWLRVWSCPEHRLLQELPPSQTDGGRSGGRRPVQLRTYSWCDARASKWGARPGRFYRVVLN